MRKMDKEQVWDRLRHIRILHQLTRTEIGHKLGVSNKKYGTWERGETMIPDWVAPILSKEFNISENWFLTGDGNKYLDNDEIEYKEMLINFISAMDYFKSSCLDFIDALDKKINKKT